MVIDLEEKVTAVVKFKDRGMVSPYFALICGSAYQPAAVDKGGTPSTRRCAQNYA